VEGLKGSITDAAATLHTESHNQHLPAVYVKRRLAVANDTSIEAETGGGIEPVEYNHLARISWKSGCVII
jgi:hypothetical protein